MGGVWLTGKDLLREGYNGKKLKMFEDIRSGKIVPRKYSKNFKAGMFRNGWEMDKSRRIFPNSEEGNEILVKARILKDLRVDLNASDETLLRRHYASISNFIMTLKFDEEKFKAYAESEEGKKMLAEFEGKRGDWKEEARKLEEEIGEPDKAIAPDKVWRDVELTEELQEKLLEAYYYLVEPGNGNEAEVNHKSPNAGGRPPSLLRQVIEAEYPHLSQGQKHLIDVDSFGKHLSWLLGQEGSKDKGTKNRSVFANERIKLVKGKGPILKIITQEYQELKGNGKKTIIESKSYDRKALHDIVRAVHKKAQKHGVKKVS